jgi:hypothetical protein
MVRRKMNHPLSYVRFTLDGDHLDIPIANDHDFTLIAIPHERNSASQAQTFTNFRSLYGVDNIKRSARHNPTHNGLLI